MKVTEDDVRYVEDLANLELTEAERSRMVRDLNSILAYIDRLNELDTSEVPPMAQVSDGYGSAEKQGTGRFEHAMRADELKPSLPHNEAMRNAPDTDGAFFRVPKVVER
ncbi:MAG: Asp-tRNA(Asn)/Glu-tRNA(Gln) amidotransferase subunit GatC [Acidobacteriaceae bacterium]|nr:Asp-tRNA(Asn)/Glu-tRNA(Gln) amidotransferase subunit GatC [Acidobacteriaceae bacterium]